MKHLVFLAAVLLLAGAFAPPGRADSSGPRIGGYLTTSDGDPILVPILVRVEDVDGNESTSLPSTSHYEVCSKGQNPLCRVIYWGATMQVFDENAARRLPVVTQDQTQRRYHPDIMSSLQAGMDHKIHKVLWTVGESIPPSAQSSIVEAYRVLMHFDRRADGPKERWNDYFNQVGDIPLETDPDHAAEAATSRAALIKRLRELADEIWEN